MVLDLLLLLELGYLSFFREELLVQSLLVLRGLWQLVLALQE